MTRINEKWLIVAVAFVLGCGGGGGTSSGPTQFGVASGNGRLVAVGADGSALEYRSVCRDGEAQAIVHVALFPFRSCVIAPPYIVNTTRPSSEAPSQGEFEDFDTKLSGCHVAPGSNTTRSAGTDGASHPISSPANAAGANDIRSKNSAGPSPASVWTTAAAVSSPITPRGDSSNGTSFSWDEWGA